MDMKKKNNMDAIISMEKDMDDIITRMKKGGKEWLQIC